MFTVVPRETEVIHPPQTEIIDHNTPAKAQTPKWKKGKHSGNIPYDTLKEQRDKLAESEKKYRARIKELESENAELSKTYETTYQENKMLKGVLQHGPDAKKVKALMKVEKEQKLKIDSLEEENDMLTKRMNEIEQIYNAKDLALDNTWNDLLAKVKKKRPNAEKVPTQGPFGGNTHANAITLYNQRQEMDSFDVQLDNVEKETQILLNKIHKLQKEKQHIGAAIDKEKGYITRNAAMNNALNDKLDRDLNNFANKLEKLKLKHKTAKAFTGFIGKGGHKHTLKSVESGDPEAASSTIIPVQDQTVPLTSVKTIEMKSPKLIANSKGIEMKSQKSSANVKTVKMESPKAQATVPISRNKNNANTTIDQRPKTEDTVQVRSNKVKTVTPRLNKTEDSHRDSKASLPISGGETSYTAANAITNYNGSRVTIAKTEKQTVITFSPEMNNGYDSNNNATINNTLNKFNASNKNNLAAGLVSNIIKGVDENASTTTDKAKQQFNVNNGKRLDIQTTNTVTEDKQKPNANTNKTNLQTKTPEKNGNGTLASGRYAHGPEPVNKKIIDPFEKKPSRYADLYKKRKERFDNTNEEPSDSMLHNNEEGMKLNFTDKVGYSVVESDYERYFKSQRTLHKYGFPLRKDSKHIIDDIPKDAVLTYLKNRPKPDGNQVSFNSVFADAKDKGSPSPIPIRFNDDAKTVGSDEVNILLVAKRNSYPNVYA